MKITQVEAIPFKIPYRAPIRWGATGYMDSAEHVLVKIHTDEGLVGVAEALPRPTFYGESQASIVYAIRSWFAPLIIGLNPGHLEKIWAKLDGIAWNPAAKGAIDMALHDLIARARGIPLWEMLGGYADRLAVGWLLDLRPLPEMIEEAVEYRAKGFKSFKVKIGLEPDKDLQVIKTLREKLGPEVVIYADGNMLYTVPTAIRVLKEMEECGLDFVEEPIAGWDFRGKVKLARALSIPIMGDESVYTPQDVAREIDLGAIGIILVKTVRTGYSLSLKIFHLAEMAGIPCLLGTAADSGIGTLCAAHLGAALRSLPYPSEISFFLRLQDDLLAEPIQIKDGFIHLPQRPGNGVVLDEAKVRKYRMD